MGNSKKTIFWEFKESESRNVEEEKDAEQTKTCGLLAHVINSVLIAFWCRSLLATPVSHFCPASYWYISSSVRVLLSFYVVVSKTKNTCKFISLYFALLQRYDMIPCSPFLMLIQSKINTERKLPNISEKYRFRKFELPIIQRKSGCPWHFE